MRCGGGSKIGGIGPGDEFFYTIGLRASIDHDRCRRPTAAMGPRSWRQSIQQSANILWNRSTLLKLDIFLIIDIYTTIEVTMHWLIVMPNGCQLWPLYNQPQSIGGNNNSTYMSFMSPLMAHVLGLPCQQSSGMLWLGWNWGLVRLWQKHDSKSDILP